MLLSLPGLLYKSVEVFACVQFGGLWIYVCVCVYGFKTFLIFENVSVNCNRLNSVFV